MNLPISPFELASLIGSIAFALSGFMVGVRKELDLMGLFIVAFLTANGGGILRDVLVDRVPFAIVDDRAVYLVLAVLVSAVLLRLHRFPGFERRTFFIISDSIGLVAFAITGSIVAIESGFDIFGTMLLAFLTATGGGIIRDILTYEIPAVLDSDFYASVALLIALILYGAHHYSVLGDGVIVLTFIGGLIVRLVAHQYHWHLPKLIKGKPYIAFDTRTKK